tara:strand:- start:4563 stop:4871 length:309 start_codon:yes stop_codon:yes gene_type:complete
MIYAIDIDGLLCNDMLGEYENSTPDFESIKRVNDLYDEGNTIKIFTGRGSATGIDWRTFTEKQLNSWGVKYHELIFGKPVCDIIVDDKAISLREWKNGRTSL